MADVQEAMFDLAVNTWMKMGQILDFFWVNIQVLDRKVPKRKWEKKELIYMDSFFWA